MKFFKSVCSLILALIMILSLWVYASAYVYFDTSYSFDLPYDFSEIELIDDKKTWMNIDETIYISVMVTENDKGDEKINPADVSDATIKKFENQCIDEFKKDNPDSDIEFNTVKASFMELGEIDALKFKMAADYKGYGNLYYSTYYFETENYIHVFSFMGYEEITEYADDIIKTVRIFDDPIKLISEQQMEKVKFITNIVAIVFACGVIIFTIIRIKRNSPMDDVKKWTHIGVCATIVVLILIKVFVW